MERLRLCMSLAWESLGKTISKSKQIFYGWLENLMSREPLSHTDFQLSDDCVMCGGKLYVDDVWSYRKQKPERVVMYCTCCGTKHLREVD